MQTPTQLVCYLSSLSTTKGSPYLLHQPSSQECAVLCVNLYCSTLHLVRMFQCSERRFPGKVASHKCAVSSSIYPPDAHFRLPRHSHTYHWLWRGAQRYLLSHWMQIGLKCLLTNCLTGSNVCWPEFKVIIFLPCKICGKVCGGGGRLQDFGSKADRSTCNHTLQYQIWTIFQIVNYTSPSSMRFCTYKLKFPALWFVMYCDWKDNNQNNAFWLKF